MNLAEIQSVQTLLSEPKKIAIVPHRNPDGDAYGSSLAMYQYLLKKGHQVTVVSPNDCPEFLKWMPGEKQIVVFENARKKATAILNEAEVIFALDFNALHRVGNEMEKVLEALKPVWFLIDHHQEPEDFADFTYVDVNVCSTCQMLYQFFDLLGDLPMIDKDIADCLYAGILTDTGSFRFPNTTSKTHLIAADLLDRGAENAKIYNRIFENSVNRLHLLGKALTNMKVLEKYRVAYITLSNAEMREFNYKKGDTEGFVNYALSLKNIVMAVIFIEDQQQGIIKMSFRSIGDFSVNELARKYFNGGGHNNAAGGRSEKSLRNTVQDFLNILPEYEQQLKHTHE